jgi:tellurite resistance protein
MNKCIEIRALEALIYQLDQTILRIDKEIIEKVEDLFVERGRTNALIAALQTATPKDARSIVNNAVRILKANGDAECDLLQYYDATYGE